MKGNKGAAQKRLRDLIGEIERGALVADRRLTFGELCDRWLESTQHRTGARAWANYAGHVKHHIRPALGAIRAEALRPAHVESALTSWIAGKRADKRQDRETLSRRTVAHVFATLRAACAWGVRMGLLVRDPSAAVEPPKVEQPEMHALDAAGVHRLFAAVRGTELENAVVVAVATGLRRGELLGLRWRDVEADDSRLTVRRSVEVIGKVLREKEPKTRRSARTLALPAFGREAIQRQRDEQRARLVDLFGELEAWRRQRDGYVLTRGDGSPWSPALFSNTFRRIVKRAGIRVRFHDLRHTYATLALTSGADLKTVSAALGHSAIGVTANTYLHAVEALQAEAADRLDSLLRSQPAWNACGTDSVPQSGTK